MLKKLGLPLLVTVVFLFLSITANVYLQVIPISSISQIKDELSHGVFRHNGNIENLIHEIQTARSVRNMILSDELFTFYLPLLAGLVTYLMAPGGPLAQCFFKKTQEEKDREEEAGAGDLIPVTEDEDSVVKIKKEN